MGNIFESEELSEVKQLSELLDLSPYSSKIKFDFSVVNDRNYYNGFVFRGFLDGVSGGVLAGGQYDNLMRRMERTADAVGFAVYLDLLEQLPLERKDYDVDVLLIYDDDTPKEKLAEMIKNLTMEEKAVSAQKTEMNQLRYRELIDLREGETLC